MALFVKFGQFNAGSPDRYCGEKYVVCQSHSETDFGADAEVMRIKCDDNVEPINIEHFREVVENIVSNVGDEDVFISTTCLEGFGSMCLSVFFNAVKDSNLGDTMKYISRAIKDQNNIPQCYKNSIFPVFSRQRFFMQWALQGGVWKVTGNKQKKNARGQTKRNRAKRIRGEVSCGEYFPRLRTRSFMTCLEMYHSYPITNSKSKEFSELHPARVGPISFMQMNQDGKMVQGSSKNLHNLMLSIRVYPSHVDDVNGTDVLNQSFFDTRESMQNQFEMINYHKEAKDPSYDEEVQPLYLLWEGEKLTQREAEIVVFSRLYHAAIEDTRAWNKLLSYTERGDNLLILSEYCKNPDEEGISLKEMMSDEKYTWTTAHVIYGIYNSITPWNDYICETN